MSNIETITETNVKRLDTIGLELAKTYKVAFAGDPWYEVSRCNEAGCEVCFTDLDAGCTCLQCGSELGPAYDSDELVNQWRDILQNDRGMIEVAFEGNYPQRATIARPTNPEELFARKYAEVPAMLPALRSILPNEFVWIEDTFANRDRQQAGNLKDRGKTLDRIADFYDGQTIATRTLANAIVRSTLRDKLARTAAYIGSEGIGASMVSEALNNPGFSLQTVPDRRTLLVVSNSGTTR